MKALRAWLCWKLRIGWKVADIYPGAFHLHIVYRWEHQETGEVETTTVGTPYTREWVEQFIEDERFRHGLIKHNPRCQSGKWQVRWSRRFPFLRVWRSQSICICAINAILKK